MDINGLVNHTSIETRRPGSLSPPEFSGSESARSQNPADSARTYPSSYAPPPRDRDGMYSPHYQPNGHVNRPQSPPLKRPFDATRSPSLAPPPAKRRPEVNGDHQGKGFPTRRRALQACEACRAKKSKCDNERPSCGSCIQHGVECIYKGAPFVPVYRPHVPLANRRLDAASMVLLEKLNKIENTMSEQATVLAQIQETTSILTPEFSSTSKLLPHADFSPEEPKQDPRVVFQVPEGRWGSLDYFLSLSFVRNLMPTSRKSGSLVIDNNNSHPDSPIPSLSKPLVQRLVQEFLDGLYPLHPVLELTALERIKREMEEDYVAYTGETAIFMQVLALGALLAGENSEAYATAAKRRLAYAVERVDCMAIQAHYLQG